MIALGIGLDLLERLARGIGQDLVELGTSGLDLLCSDLDLGLLALGSTAGLVNHHERVGQAEALTRGTTRK